ncbi:BQ2448_3171 [Microbotryum intermedium]|uniref:BQ2448_3171 protein n=1 Tax=Microbotryum intermedium TaxID=269621 RepID=A0A238FHW3_9BASI|nr:BQ2448_3171 [Microbotryum intermedium]
MVRSYLRHGPTESFGVIASSSSNSVYDGKRAYVPALEDVLVWDVKKGEQHAMWHETGLKALVTSIARSPVDWDQFAVGYADGSIRVWSAATTSVIVTLNGHKSAVSALAWDRDGARLVSGSKDTDVILWDVIAEVGLFRLRGHRDQITGLIFVAAPPQAASSSSEEDAAEREAEDGQDSSSSRPAPSTHLLTSSKDTFIKLFDLSTQHCIETVVGHRGEAWSIAYDPNSAVLVSGGGEGEVKCWKLDALVLERGITSELDATTTSSQTPRTSASKLKRAIRPLMALHLPNTSHAHNITQITLHPTLPVLAVHSGEKTIDVFRLRTEEELRKKLARRRRREREKTSKRGKGKEKQLDDDAGDDDRDDRVVENAEGEIEWRDRLAIWSVIRAGGKVRSFAFAPETAKTKGDVQILAALSNNSLEVYNLPKPASSKAPAVEPVKMYSLDIPGHRSDVRTLCVSSDDALIASASQGSLKIWNLKTTKCIRTLECGYAICSTFLPGDRHVVIGTKAGEVLLYDLGSSTLLETFSAHTGPVWSLHVRPDGRGLVTGSADKDVKFWDFEVREIPSEVADGPVTRVLTMAHVRTLKMTDDILAIKYSPDGRLLAVSLLDSTVKVFYADTLKFFLSLYGHKLPVLALDISSDSKLIVTCSADKNIKIWGLDFGDCHRSLFGHDESIMQVAFERGTHYFWSVGKDKMVKYWDGDKVSRCQQYRFLSSERLLITAIRSPQFECIQKLAGHAGEIWALAVSHRANFVITGSHDKSIRIWEKTDEPLFLEEEREREIEEMYDSNLNGRGERDEMRVLPNGEEVVGPEATDVSKSTTETLMAGERIIEALELSMLDQQQSAAYEEEVAGMSDKQKAKVPVPSRTAVFQMYDGVGPHEYVLKVVRKIPAASLHDALLVLPFTRVTQLIEHLDVWAHKEWQITLTSRVLFFLLRTHHSQIVATRALRETMMSLRAHLRAALNRQKDMIGYNLAALKYLQRQHDANKTADFFEKDVEGVLDEEKVREKIEMGLKKRKRATLRS